MRATGNTILITGGGSGIGRGLAEAFHAQGNRVIIAGRRAEALAAVANANPGMVTVTVDVTDATAIPGFASELITAEPTLNAIINCAGIMRPEKLTAVPFDLATAEATVITNLLAPIRLIHAFLPHLMQQPAAAILNVTSGLAFVPLAATPTYSATKAALHSYTQSLRHQLRGTSVSVIEIPPPHVQTELMGPHQARDPAAMPLGDFIAETMAILRDQPNVEEAGVERVKPLRLAEASGQFDAVFAALNQLAV